MTNRTRRYHYLGLALAAVGTLLVVLGFVQDATGLSLFDDSPFIVGVGVAAVGAALAWSGRPKARAPRG